MHIKVGPARRPGGATTIYSEPLKHGDVLVDPSGGFTLTIEASGMKDAKSRYRYRIYLTRGEAETLRKATAIA